MYMVSCLSQVRVKSLSLFNFHMSMVTCFLVERSVSCMDTSVVSYLISIPYLFVLYVLHSVVMYLCHTALHSRWFYTPIHTIHHEMPTAGWWSAFYCHPLEMVLMLYTLHIPKIVSHIQPIPRITLWTWNMAGSIHYLYRHGPLSPWSILVDVTHAQGHHTHHNLNYSSEWMDRWCGTEIE